MVDDNNGEEGTTHTSPDMTNADDGGAGPPPPRRFNKKTLPDNFMTGDDILSQCSDLIDKLLQDRLTVERLDAMYDEMLNVYYSEMSKFLREIKQTPKSKKAH